MLQRLCCGVLLLAVPLGAAWAQPNGGTMPTGAAGTANSRVLTVQGIASMTPVQVGGTVAVSGLPALPAGSNAIGSINNTTFAATESGTWTVQPGNTANTTPWLVTGTGGVFPASQSGVWTSVVTQPTAANLNATVVGNGTFATQVTSLPALPTGANAIGSITNTGFNASQPTAANLNATVVGSGTAGTAAGGVLTVQGATSMTPVQVTQTAATPAGTNVIGHVISDTGSTTAVTGNVTATQATGSNLHIVCDSGCSSSTAPADESAFTAGTTSQTPVGGLFQTTATSNPLTTGQMGAFQVTAQRALFNNLRNASGAEIGVAAAPLQVSLANTASNGTAISVSATQSGNWTSRTVGNAGAVLDFVGQNAASPANSLLTGCQFNTSPTTITTTNASPIQCDSSGNVLINLKTAIPSGTNLMGKVGIDQTTVGTTNGVSLAQIGATTVSSGAGATGTGTQRVGVAQDTTTIAGAAPGIAGSASANVLSIQGIASMTKLLVTPDSVALPANQSTNEAQINGVTPLMGNGASGTGAQRVTIANDSTGQVVQSSQYPNGAVPVTASATGTTAATTATLAASASIKTYLCGFSIRANATAAATANSTVTGTITGTLNYTQWTAPNASGLGITEQVFSPCVPSSAINTGIAVISAAAGTGGVVSVSAWGYQL